MAQLHLSVYKPHTTQNYSISSDRRATTRKVKISLRWPIHIINPVDKTPVSRFPDVPETFFKLWEKLYLNIFITNLIKKNGFHQTVS